MDTPAPGATFEVTFPGAAEAADEFGVWQASGSALESLPAAPGEGSGRAPAIVWNVDLPDDPRLAGVAQAGQAARLARAEMALPDAARRLRAFVDQSLRKGPESFSTGLEAIEPVLLPEQALAAWTAPQQEVSFGPFDRLPDDWREATERAMAFFQSVREATLSLSVVRSASAGRPYALTSIALDGDLRTAWGSLGQDHAEQHAANLELVLRARTNWLRMALLILQGGLQLGVLFPANPLLAVPAAYKFFKKVLELAQELELRPIP